MVKDPTQGGGQAEVTEEQREAIRGRLKAFREERGWSARELAERAGIQATTVARWGGDREDIPSTGNLLRLALSPGVRLNPRWLLLGEPDQPWLLDGISRPAELTAMLGDYVVSELAVREGEDVERVRRWLPSGGELLLGVIELCLQRVRASRNLESTFNRPLTAADVPATTLTNVPYMGVWADLLIKEHGPAGGGSKGAKKSPKKGSRKRK